MSIIRCLTDGRPNQANFRLSPSGTDASSQFGDAEIQALRAMSLPLRSSLAPELTGDEMMGLVSNSSPEVSKIEPLVQISPRISSNGEDNYSWHRWINTEQDRKGWVRKATIRHTNQVELISLQVTIPEDTQLLQTCLKLCFPHLSVKNSARKLLISLKDNNMAVTTWVKATSWQGYHLTESNLKVRALVYFRSMLRPGDWQITRQMLCILCSENAIEGLAQIANLSGSTHRIINGSDDVQCERFLQAINSLNLIGGTRSVGLALAQHQLSLRAITESAESTIFEWSKFPPNSDDRMTGEELHGMMLRASTEQEVFIPDVLTPYIKKNTWAYIVPVGSYQQGPHATTLDIPNFKTHGVLIKKPNIGLIETSQNFCFFVIDENVRFDDETKLGRLLEESYKAKDFFRIGAPISRGDRELISQWIQVLKGLLPQNTLLE